MWIDTHCHLDAHEFGDESAAQALQARALGVGMIVVPAVATANFDIVAQLAGSVDNACYALGIHPIYVPQASEDDLRVLRERVEAAMGDARMVAIGEIGLDFFLPMLTEPAMRDKQIFFFREQLKIARDFDLPVLMHVRRSQDVVLKHARQIKPAGGIAHAFNGSFQQAQGYIDLGFKLGFGGAMTFTRALQIRRLAAELPLSSIVLKPMPQIFRQAGSTRAATAPIKSRASAPCWPNCAASPSMKCPRPPPTTPTRLCRACADHDTHAGRLSGAAAFYRSARAAQGAGRTASITRKRFNRVITSPVAALRRPRRNRSVPVPDKCRRHCARGRRRRPARWRRPDSDRRWRATGPS